MGFVDIAILRLIAECLLSLRFSWSYSVISYIIMFKIIGIWLVNSLVRLSAQIFKKQYIQFFWACLSCNMPIVSMYLTVIKYVPLYK